MLRTRALSAIILLPVVATVIYLGGWWYCATIIVIACLAGYELYRLMAQADTSPALWLGLAMIAVLIISGQESAWQPWLGLALTLLVLASLVWHMSRADRRTPAIDWAVTIAGAVYLGWLGSHFITLRLLPDGMWWLALVLLSTWVTDSGAYFVGRRWGQRPLAPQLSPKKTWEGAIGGWLIGVILTPPLALGLGLPLIHGLFIGIIVATLAPFGDLAESMFKRQVGAKDSSNLIPGHGGMLDRIDSLLFVVPASTYYLLCFVN